MQRLEYEAGVYWDEERRLREEGRRVRTGGQSDGEEGKGERGRKRV